jgi:hypothetical protein
MSFLAPRTPCAGARARANDGRKRVPPISFGAGRGPAGFVRSACALSLCLALLAPGVLAQKSRTTPLSKSAPARQGKSKGEGVGGKAVRLSKTAVADLAELASEAALDPAGGGPEETRAIPPPRPMPPDSISAEEEAALLAKHAAEARGERDDVVSPAVAGPTPSQSYHAQEDGPRTGTTSRFIPPDIHGAVGLTRSMTVTNNNYRVYDKLTGAPLSTVGIQTFWAPLAPPAGSPAETIFDPRVQYDPYNNRFIHYVLSGVGGIGANNRLLVAVSQTGDPNGTYNYYSYIVGTSNLGADFPTVGFNKNWLVVGLNMFAVASGGVTQGNLITIDYPAARSGAPSPTAVRFVTPDNVFFFGTGLCPADTYDPNLDAVYVLRNFNNNTTGRLQMYRVTGTPTSPAVAPVNDMINSGDFWNTGSEGNFLPQLNTSSTVGAAASTLGIEAGDARIQNVVYRNGSVWAVHKIGIPATVNTATVRVGVQWWQLTTTGAITQRGRIEDPTATQANGGSHYAWPAIAVNRNNDVIINYSEFEEDDYADTGYSFRLAADAANTMRDPVIYQEGLDNYAGADSNGRVRWGDYTMAVPDPSNDRDLWVVGEYAHLKVPVTGGFSSRHDTWWAKVSVAGGILLISEFTARGPGGGLDEFVEIFNPADSPHTVLAADGSAGYAVAAEDGLLRCTVPNGTVIPARGHFLCANTGYSYSSYAAADTAILADIGDQQGVALFNTANPANFSSLNRFDAFGYTTSPSLYREGAGFQTLTPGGVMGGISFYRNLSSGRPQDTEDNAADFIFVSTLAPTETLGGSPRLGAPGPEGLASPIQRNQVIKASLIDPSVSFANPPNTERSFTVVPNGPQGTFTIRRRFTNNTGGPVTRLRFRIVDLTVFPQPAGTSDLRAITSGNVIVSTTSGPVEVRGTTLEQPPNQPNGGGLNSTLAEGTITNLTPLAPGASVNVQFVFGVVQTGAYRFFVNVEALP